MEEPKAAQNPPPTQDPNPPATTATAAQTTPPLPPQQAAQTTPPPPPPQQEPPQPQPTPPPPPPPRAPSTAPEQPTSKKRPLESSNDQLQSSKYFKMRLLLKDLRPHFIEVLQTPDFRNCKAADEIKEKMKLLVELYKQMTSEVASTGRSQPLPGETGMKPKPKEQPQVVKQAVSSENKTFQLSNISEKQKSEDGEALATYIVGGSAFGWNFITFTGNTPVYYGVTKEAFRSAQATLEGK